MADTLQGVRDKVDSEGFDYAFRQYSNFNFVEDAEFHRLREAYVTAAAALETYLNERTTGEGDEEEEEEDEDDDS